MSKQSLEKRNIIAQWAFDTRPILGRFHLWLEDIEERWIRREGDGVPFTGSALQRAFTMAIAVTALGTKLFGRWGEGKGLDKAALNRVKKDADAVSAYALSEALWHLTRHLPENHAVMVSLGEGLMPKVGETPEMGSNPLLGFGRVYARPQVAKFLDKRVHQLLNKEGYEWREFWREIQAAGITIWGAAVDTLENTSRFAKGKESGPLAVLHLFDQPLNIVRPYEGYIGNLILPKKVKEAAEANSIWIDFLSPREVVLRAIKLAYPELKEENIHVWTLGGKSRAKRIGKLWEEWRSLGVHVVEDGWIFPPTGQPVFVESGTYAPTFRVGPFKDEKTGEQHLFICDGYAASAEAIQAASLSPLLQLHTSLCLFSSKFKIPYYSEAKIMRLDPQSPNFERELAEILEKTPTESELNEYRSVISEAKTAGMPVGSRTFDIDYFFPNKEWEVLALAGFMLPDPYTGAPGVEKIDDQTYRVTAHTASKTGIRETAITLRMMEPLNEMKLVFSPLLDRFYYGQDYRNRPVKISDSGRIRNELQTLCPQALEYLPDERIRVHLDWVDDAVLPPDKKELIRDVLKWYKQNHPIWFRWLEIE